MCRKFQQTYRKRKAYQAAKKPQTLEVPSRQRVLGTIELLEAILLHLDIRTLLTSAQRVCITWHDLTTSSPLLQRRLFLTPSPSPSTPTYTRPPYTPNPLLVWAFPCFFPSPRTTPSTLQMNPNTHWHSTSSIPYPGCMPPPAHYGFLPAGLIASNEDKTEYLPMADTRDGRRRHYACVRAGASWRRMLLSQPPVVRVARLGGLSREEVGRRAGGDARNDGSWSLGLWDGKMVEIEGGLRMGELYDEVYRINWVACEGVYWQHAWVGWKGADANVGDVKVGGSGMDEEGTEGWLRSADLVLADKVAAGVTSCGTHPIRNGGRLCFLHHQKEWGNRKVRYDSWKWVYTCEEMEPEGRLGRPRGLVE